ncbi:MerR family transcriptional regulator [Rarobacter faecitabidus]|uniref:DNA-binding transcriptional MerR regulator n=1 Tax=Rarobacter faecitabidus TaxID=13243 RepID=A0A542ZP61_RARFA|nr:MerR family transcriptional regulator [Rarobacter faecitabidus]TQL62164.1 DNA-binding transcriptional MerR regulator [Rarobacter faecitabidus]
MNDSASTAAGSRGVYSIAVAAELVGLGEQALRLYERKGLIAPSRTTGGTRRYSEDDLTVLRRVIELRDAGVNLAGARHVLELESANRLLQSQLDELRMPENPAG